MNTNHSRRKEHTPNQKLKEAREAHGWSQEDIAEQIGLDDPHTVSRWERGISVPRPSYRRKLALLFGKSLDELGLLKEISPTAIQPVFPLPLPRKATTRLLAKIPRPATPLLGREQECADLQALLNRQEVQLLTLLGCGGVGKTRLGIEVVSQVSSSFPDRLCFVSLVAVTDPALIASAIARELEIQEDSTIPLMEQVKTFLQEQCFLLMLDSFEHIIQAAPLLEDLLACCPRLKVLATSREALRLPAEFRFTVSPLPLLDLTPAPDYGELAGSAALSLFEQRAQAHSPAFQITPQNIQAIAELCKRLDGLPLAIELAASHIELLPPPILLARIPQHLHVLKNRLYNAPYRQRTLYNTLKWSYDLLRPQDQWLFRHLSVFAGGATLTTLETFFATSERPAFVIVERIASLLDKSLLLSLHSEYTETRIMMLETLRHYGLDCLRAEDEFEACQRSYALFYLDMVEQVAGYLTSKKQQLGLQQLEQEQDNLRAALSWLIERSEGVLALRFCEAFGKFCGLHGYWHEEWRWLSLTLELPQVPEGKAIRARVLRRAGHLAYRFRDLTTARQLHEESIALARELDDWLTLAGALSGLGWVRYRQQAEATTYQLLHESVAAARTSGNSWSLANTLESLGRFLHYTGKTAEASQLVTESVSLSRKLADKECLARILTTLAEMEIAQGHHHQATLLAEESFLLAQKLRTRPLMALALSCLGDVALQQKAYAQARKHFEASIALAYDLGDEPAIANRQQKLADIVLLQRA